MRHVALGSKNKLHLGSNLSRSSVGTFEMPKDVSRDAAPPVSRDASSPPKRRRCARSRVSRAKKRKTRHGRTRGDFSAPSGEVAPCGDLNSTKFHRLRSARPARASDASGLNASHRIAAAAATTAARSGRHIAYLVQRSRDDVRCLRQHRGGRSSMPCEFLESERSAGTRGR